ncbi:unnamed protein product, partial [Darwinula stevensoni]
MTWLRLSAMIPSWFFIVHAILHVLLQQGEGLECFQCGPGKKACHSSGVEMEVISCNGTRFCVKDYNKRKSVGTKW